MKLQIDLKSTDTSRPILADGYVQAQIADAEVVPSKKITGNFNLMVKFTTTETVVSNKGDNIKAGYPLRRYFQLQQSDNPDAPDFTIDLARLFDAAFDIKDPEDRPVIDDVSVFKQLIDRPVKLRISHEESEGYGVQNVVKEILAAGK